MARTGVYIPLESLIWVDGLATTNKFNCLKAVIGVFIVYQYAYFVALGSTWFVALAESATARLRTKTAALGIIVQNAIVVSSPCGLALQL